MSTATSQALHIAQRTQPCLRTSLMHPFCSKHYTSDHRHVPYCSKVHSSPGGNAGLKLGGSTRLSCLSKLPPKYARSQVQACATRGEGDAGPKPSSTTDAEVERGSSSQKQGDQASLQLLRQRMAEVQKEEEEEGEEDYHDFLNSYQDIDFDSLEIDDKLLFEELGLTPEEVEQQRDLSRAGFTDPEGIEFDHDEVSNYSKLCFTRKHLGRDFVFAQPGGSLPSVPASLWH
uniref:Uncharacterized protein n=1 Tax=Dunaliella tertiolecta TaxID=3047 RepID=A0A7S3VKT0_DUNTE